MSYEPKIWKTGDIIEAEALNHMENGIAAVEKQQGPAGPAGADGQDRRRCGNYRGNGDGRC